MRGESADTRNLTQSLLVCLSSVAERCMTRCKAINEECTTWWINADDRCVAIAGTGTLAHKCCNILISRYFGVVHGRDKTTVSADCGWIVKLMQGGRSVRHVGSFCSSAPVKETPPSLGSCNMNVKPGPKYSAASMSFPKAVIYHGLSWRYLFLVELSLLQRGFLIPSSMMLGVTDARSVCSLFTDEKS